MNRYTIYCTAEQTKKALELGAPIEYGNDFYHKDYGTLALPTAEQLIGWLRTQGYTPYTYPVTKDGQDVLSARLLIQNKGGSTDIFCGFGKDYTIILAAIDKALKYLSNKK